MTAQPSLPSMCIGGLADSYLTCIGILSQWWPNSRLCSTRPVDLDVMPQGCSPALTQKQENWLLIISSFSRKHISSEWHNGELCRNAWSLANTKSCCVSYTLPWQLTYTEYGSKKEQHITSNKHTTVKQDCGGYHYYGGPGASDTEACQMSVPGKWDNSDSTKDNAILEKFGHSLSKKLRCKNVSLYWETSI